VERALADKEALKQQAAHAQQQAEVRVKLHKDDAAKQRSSLEMERKALEGQKQVTVSGACKQPWLLNNALTCRMCTIPYNFLHRTTS